MIYSQKKCTTDPFVLLCKAVNPGPAVQTWSTPVSSVNAQITTLCWLIVIELVMTLAALKVPLTFAVGEVWLIPDTSA